MAIQPVTPYAPPASAAQANTVGRVAQATNTDEAADAEQAKEAEAVALNPPSREQLDRAVNEVRKALAPVARNLQFSIDDETGRSVVKVVDSSTNEVIRQLPSEELLAITRSMDKLSGLFVKQKA